MKVWVVVGSAESTLVVLRFDLRLRASLSVEKLQRTFVRGATRFEEF